MNPRYDGLQVSWASAFAFVNFSSWASPKVRTRRGQREEEGQQRQEQQQEQ